MSSSLKRHLYISISGTVGLKVAGIVLTFAANVILARALGPAGFGSLAFVIAWVNILVTVVLFGGNFLLAREVAALNSRKAWGTLRGLLRWADMQTLLLVGITGAVIVIGSRLLTGADDGAESLFVLAIPLLLCRALFSSREAILRGFQRILLAQLPDVIIRPLGLAVFGLAFVFVLGERFNVTYALYVYILTFGIALLFTLLVTGKAIPREVSQHEPHYEIRYWLACALPLFGIALCKMLEAELAVVALGHLSTPESVGQFAVARRGAQLVNIAFLAVNITIGPTIAQYFAEGKLSEIRHLGTHSARLATLVAAPLMLGLFVFGKWFLAIFGPEFVAGNTLLRLLLLGQLFNVATGSVAMWLTMTNKAWYAITGLACAVVVNLILCLVLIPMFDAYGAAIASVIALIVSNTIMVVMVWRTYRIDTTVLGIR